MTTKYVTTTALLLTLAAGQGAFAATVAPTAQSGLVSGNDKLNGQPAQVALTIATFDALTTGYFEPNYSYYEIGKLETANASNGVENSDEITVTGDGGAVNATSGSWTYGGADTPFIVVYKGGPNFIAQFFEGGISGNMYNLADFGLLNNGGQTAGLSHLTLYGVDGQPTTVPLPAAGLMLLAGLGGLVGMKRRKH